MITPLTDSQHDDNQRRLFALETRMTELIVKVESFGNAFPDNDLEGHCRYHATAIEMLLERRRLRVAIQEKTISGLVWGLLVFIGFSVWEYLKRKLGTQ